MVDNNRLTLNPRVSVFRYNGGIYLFDPATRTYVSMNEAMLAFVTKPANANSFDKLSNKNRKGLKNVVDQLHRLGILIEPDFAGKNESYSNSEGPPLMTELTIFVTTKCNLRCAYCYAHGGDSGKTISRDVWRLAMDYFFSSENLNTIHRSTNNNNVNLTLHGGGEPTVEFAVVKEIVADFCDVQRGHS